MKNKIKFGKARREGRGIVINCNILIPGQTYVMRSITLHGEEGVLMIPAKYDACPGCGEHFISDSIENNICPKCEASMSNEPIMTNEQLDKEFEKHLKQRFPDWETNPELQAMRDYINTIGK